MPDVLSDCGGAWIPDDTGGGGTGTMPGHVLKEIAKLAGHGIVISGVITWIQAQIDTLGSDIWRSLAERCFLAKEVTAAKDALKGAKGTVLETLMPEFKTNRSGPNKKSKEIDDIKKAIEALTQAKQMPLVLASSQQMLRCPQSWGVPESPTSQDVMGKIYHLEKALSDSIEIQKENMIKIREEIQSSMSAAVKSTIPIISVTEDTPSKKRKYEEASINQHAHQLQQEQQPLQQTYAGVAGISPIGRKQNQPGFSLLQGLLQKNQPPQSSKNLCYGSAKTTTGGGDGTKLSGDVSLVATGVAKDCTEKDLKEFLAEKGIQVVEVEKLTKPEVIELVRTITFRVAVKAADYEAALKPEVWPYRVGVRHYRAPKRPDSGWAGQSRQSGGNISPGRSGVPQSSAGGSGYPGSRQYLPPGHPSRVSPSHQIMGPTQPGPIELSNFWNILQTLGGQGMNVGMSSHP